MSHEIDKLAWVHIKNNRVLMARSHGKAMFYVPGGKREAGESDQAALIREIKEEVAVDLIPETLSYLGTYYAQADGKPEGTQVKLTCYQSEFQGECRPSAEIEEIVWISYNEKDKCSQVARILLENLKASNLIDAI
ncbi:NUDIX hydrolase [Photobacterium galatheae]|uniref:Nudix hydrolase domain-containing protein n=1 Tax=Photobacterium galatheae TaxID=1654360 RepID=A0A066S106_9GAMM|nr:NUDIX domain-containing protein [Photobacterium galatheae]KDM93313.1 hypothetical protein EA58_01500 [Photobacterium galatheae]MCM0150436.1 NUDIX domain-containing protein [Photobacterium galatheae]